MQESNTDHLDHLDYLDPQRRPLHYNISIFHKFLWFNFFFVPALLQHCSLCLDHFEGGTEAYTCLALPCGSRAGADLGRTSGSEDDASPV